jgi:hypothetical protein
LRDVTAALPPEGGAYVTNFNLNDDMKGTLAGKAANEQGVLALLDRLKASGKLADVKASFDARGAGKGGREVTFAMTFNYAGGG